MNLNLDGSSPWFHVHFTLPNQSNKRSQVKYDSERKRIKELIQSKDAFLAPTSKRNIHRSVTKPIKPRGDTKKKLGSETTGNLELKTPWFNQNNSKKAIGNAQRKTNSVYDRICFDSEVPNTIKRQDKDSILPPLQGNKLTGSKVCCQGQRDVTTENKTDNNDVKETDKRSIASEVKSENKLSIADCYDLCNWKPQNSLCREARPLVSILKQNTGIIEKRTLRPQGQHSVILETSESSGTETENESTKRNKRVRFAKGTKFSQSIKSRKYRAKQLHLDKLDSKEISTDDKNNLEDMIELSFREFIRRKRLERSKVMAEISKDSSTLYFLKEENKLPKVNLRKQQKSRTGKSNGEQEDCQSKVDTLLPTVVN